MVEALLRGEVDQMGNTVWKMYELKMTKIS